MHFFSFFKRYTLAISISIILFTALGAFYGATHNSNNAKTTLFLTIATQSSKNPEQAEVAATYFGETLMGWFRNPAFTHSIIEETQIQGASLSALKQERQNLLVEANALNSSDAKTLADATLQKLRDEVKRYNQASKSEFVIINQGRTTQINNSGILNFLIAGALFGFILIILLLAFKEFLRNEVSSVEEVENILGVQVTDFLKQEWEKNDYTLLSILIQKLSPMVILAGVGISTDVLTVALAHKHSFFGEKIALVDGDLKCRDLQTTLGLSSRMKNLKGHTDTILMESDQEENEVNTALVMQNTLDENLKFLPAGKGHHFLTEVFHNISMQMKTLIHTQLPENLEVLRLNNASLILVVHIGVTKVKDLQRIKQIWNNSLHVIVVE